MPPVDEYSARIASEVYRYADVTAVHHLPDIYHYWSDKYIRPKLNAIGFDTIPGFFSIPFAELCQRTPHAQLRFLSIGAGNCDFELEVAQALTAAGHKNFVIDCLDINTVMLERGTQAAAEANMSAHIAPLQGDFNEWQPAHEYDGVFAAQALHHVLNLEGLFSQINASLKPHGRFITSDMIGRNGHQRWPEALEAVRHFWRRLPPSYRFNWQLRRYEEMFQDWNCVDDAFEGIRSQDILPLLLDNFHFERFAAFGNVIDPFVDRGFGPNFRPFQDQDRAFIDEVHAFDERSFRSGALSPTHLFAVMTKNPVTSAVYADGLTPERALRREPMASVDLPPAPRVDLSDQERHVNRILLALEGERRKFESQVRTFPAEYEKLQAELKARTDWALSLDAHIKDLTQRLIALNGQAAPVASLKSKLKRFLRGAFSR